MKNGKNKIIVYIISFIAIFTCMNTKCFSGFTELILEAIINLILVNLAIEIYNSTGIKPMINSVEKHKLTKEQIDNLSKKEEVENLIYNGKKNAIPAQFTSVNIDEEGNTVVTKIYNDKRSLKELELFCTINTLIILAMMYGAHDMFVACEMGVLFLLAVEFILILLDVSQIDYLIRNNKNNSNINYEKIEKENPKELGLKSKLRSIIFGMLSYVVILFILNKIFPNELFQNSLYILLLAFIPVIIIYIIISITDA